MIFREFSKGTVKSINITKSSIEESTIYQYISLPVSGNYTVTGHDIVDGTIITNPSVVYPQVLKYILLLPSPIETIIITSKYYVMYYIAILFYILLGTIPNDETGSLISDITSTTNIMTSIVPTIGISDDIGMLNVLFRLLTL